ncbi:heterokaryon incompatibility protein-domain-containing protein [Nemania abortiva]|nr:heterokaryon incompatibility protein-domain-containing protein [Nemania abortiva]
MKPDQPRHRGVGGPAPESLSHPAIVDPKQDRFLGSSSRHTFQPWERSMPTTDAVQHYLRMSSSSSGSLGHDAYQYQELAPLEFRLVHLFAKTMSAIRCEIIHESLANPPPYTAISYAWGDADDKRSIQIGNLNIPVAVSLFGALDAVRQGDSNVLVWVDALCIDQQNRDERSRQVQLMTEIYTKAENVAVWLGPSADDSELAIKFLQNIYTTKENSRKITELLLSPSQLHSVRAVAFLFQRDYWKRLWVTQEVFNAANIKVYCGNSAGLPWDIYENATRIFQEHKKELDSYFSMNTTAKGSRLSGTQNSFSYSQALVYEGPNNLYNFGSLDGLGKESLLVVMRACRRKFTSEPRDKIYGILGMLPDNIRKEFPIDYNKSIKEIYTNVVDFLLHTTDRMDVICESIHFPKLTGGAELPSWVPDWSQSPEITALGYSYNFCASGETRGKYYKLLDGRRNELEISALFIDTVRIHGVAVGTLCILADYLMAFLHWRAMLTDFISSETEDSRKYIEEAFCWTLCLGQVPLSSNDRSRVYSPSEWMKLCYNAFAAQLHSRLPYIRLDDDLLKHIDIGLGDKVDLRHNFASRMMGRCFFLTKMNRMGMGTGCMLPGDIIVIPLGCRTPIVIRKAKQRERFQYVGDVYLDGYMYGKAVNQMNNGERPVEKFVLV